MLRSMYKCAAAAQAGVCTSWPNPHVQASLQAASRVASSTWQKLSCDTLSQCWLPVVPTDSPDIVWWLDDRTKRLIETVVNGGQNITVDFRGSPITLTQEQVCSCYTLVYMPLLEWYAPHI